ncbi:TetR/AcrR family transcriptional regulator [Streptomyces sp. B1866]|uniref:TetR/AcrR family transcriptional regulator n=1 Tax=Streptomyces sp. B1866 TaxID=3075431 RepID=UPI00288D3D83|nr:TetR/AcrR family transcriptional regulator [Streptomyces sp. B1866]MDT3395136.1 TetR/AcrR family transcriptional regulator [Streptomyces sp. B1866]
MRPAEPGQRALLDAGLRLLATTDVPRLSVNAVVAAAGMAKGSFYQHWRSRHAYLVTLHRAFHDRLARAVEAATAPLPPGRDRLATGIAAYLDGCLADPATKALLVQARTDADLGPEVGARNRAFTAVAVADLAALGWRPAEPVATLLVAAVAETALHELAAGEQLDALRGAVLRLAAREPHEADADAGAAGAAGPGQGPRAGS